MKTKVKLVMWITQRFAGSERNEARLQGQKSKIFIQI